MIKVIVFLIAGAIINVAVAWGFSQSGLRGAGVMTHPSAVSKSLWKNRPESFRQPDAYSEASVSCFGLTAITVVGFDEAESPSFEIDVPFSVTSDWCSRLYVENISPLIVFEDCQEIRAGWPKRSLRAFQWNQWYPPNGGNPVRDGFVRYNGWPARNSMWLPFELLCPGFAINTIFYAAILWMLFAAPAGVRRRIRIKRGQCAACGYSLRESASDKCPECGAAFVRDRSTRERRV